MSAEWIGALAPVAQAIVNKITSGQKVDSKEHQFILLYSLVENTNESNIAIKQLGRDFEKLNACLGDLTKLLNEVRAETSYIKAKVDNR